MDISLMKYLLGLLLIATPALAQVPSDAQLDTALGICNQHLLPPPAGTHTGLFPPYAPGWEKCDAIRKEVIARKASAGVQQQQQDINNLAGQLGK